MIGRIQQIGRAERRPQTCPREKDLHIKDWEQLWKKSTDTSSQI
jgi:hypothetical protein